ncbi:MAG: metallopeptidase TldD-related protein, partial [Candidatus Cloacimonetes bacterium]|nr:metallopeptidase TldD-related protein [Candidatus Cloacimonadota bacterium]
KEAKGDLLTMGTDPTLPGGNSTEKYDYLGTLLKPHTFIEQGKIVKLSSTKRTSIYLNLPVTGRFTNLVVSGGSKNYNDLLEEGVLILSRFSTFTPNPSTGAFSGEIRNGRMYKNGTFTPIKGGSVTGTMDKAMQEAFLSKELVQRYKYFGPQWIKISNLDVAGDQ